MSRLAPALLTGANTRRRSQLMAKATAYFRGPFYYIEYGMAQLGAIAVWKNYKENPEKGLQQYLDALKLGYNQNHQRNLRNSRHSNLSISGPLQSWPTLLLTALKNHNFNACLFLNFFDGFGIAQF